MTIGNQTKKYKFNVYIDKEDHRFLCSDNYS